MKPIVATIFCLATFFGLIPSAHADNFITCPSGRSGVATNVTSCGFADNVRLAWFGQPGNPVVAYSPETGLEYSMICNSGTVRVAGMVMNGYTCYGGEHAEVVIW